MFVREWIEKEEKELTGTGLTYIMTPCGIGGGKEEVVFLYGGQRLHEQCFTKVEGTTRVLMWKVAGKGQFKPFLRMWR
jgi:hypothetical protein